MTDARMTLYDLVPQSGDVTIGGAATRFLYVREGSFTVNGAAGQTSCASDEGVLCDGEVRVAGRGVLWVYEVAPPDVPVIGADRATIVLSRVLSPGFAGPWLIRADRVESTTGSKTPRHGHRGPGMRRLVYGQLLAEIGDEIDRIDAGRAWFETGRDWVVGTNISNANSAFVRVMVLPAELKGGKSSFIPATPEDAAKPRAVTYRLFGEALVDQRTPGF